MVKIHNIKFYEPNSRAIYCMTIQKNKYKLALSRSDSCIEIWNLRNLPYIERIISSTLNCNIQGLIWSNDRMFSCSLQGFLHEYDLQYLSIKHKESVIGEAAFCLDVDKNNSNIVVGTENGYLNIFNILENEVKFVKFLDKQEGRILCVKYDYTGDFIVSGSVDVIRIWDVNKGHALHKMTTGRTEIHKSTVVWCLELTSDFTIISGDSRGKLTFWDGKIGSQIESYQSHKADILSLTLSDDEGTLFCAGADSTLISYVKINIKDRNTKWVKSIQRRAHDHDVRALILFNNKLYSAGIDGYLACTFHPPKTLIKYPPVFQNNCITVCKDLRLIHLQYSTHIEVWKLGTPSEKVNEIGVFQLKDNAEKLLHLERVLKNDSNELCREAIVCSSISTNGKWIAFSSPTALKLYQFIFDDLEKPHLKPIKSLPSECKVSIKLLFTPNEELVLVLCCGSMVIVNLQDLTVKQIIETNTVFSDTILHLLVSPDGKYLVASDVNSNICVWVNNLGRWKYYCKLPKYTCAPTAAAVQPVTNNLWISYSDHNIVEYHLDNRKFSNFSKQLDIENIARYANKWFPIRNITFDLVDPNIVLLHDDTHIVVIDKKKQSLESVSKAPKLSLQTEDKSPVKTHRNCFSSYKKYQHLVHLESLSKNELIAVEVSPLKLMEQLPPCLIQNTFGTK